MNNKRIGNKFEKELAEILSKEGYWVTNITPKQHIGSQPCDLIAIKNNKTILIDCKTSKTHLFPISRIEENQWQAYKKYKKCGNTNYYIAIKYNENIYTIPINEINIEEKNINLKERKISINKKNQKTEIV